jgi:hypothetical protein
MPLAALLVVLGSLRLDRKSVTLEPVTSRL